MRLLILFILLLCSWFVNGQIVRTHPYYKPPVSSGCSYLLDQYSGAAAAYSLRKLRCAYSGSLIRVRRSSDNTEQDIGATANGDLDTAALKTFVGTGGSDDGYVTTWYDQSGNANNATQATSGNQPLVMDNGVVLRQGTYPTVKFDGGNDYFGFTNISSNGDWSVFVVVKRASAGVIGNTVASSGTGPTITQYSDNNFYIQRTTSGTDYYSYAADATADFSLLNGYNISNVMSAYKNGTAYSLSAELTFAGTSENWNTISRYNATYSNSNMSEILIWTSDQSANRTGIQTNINNYWTIY